MKIILKSQSRILSACLLMILPLLALISCSGTNTCDTKHCSKTSSGIYAIGVKFNMDSLAGGFTQAQLRKVYVFTDIYTDSIQMTTPTYNVLMDGPVTDKKNFIMIKNENTGTVNRFDNFVYYKTNPDCCPDQWNYAIKTFNYNGQANSASYTTEFKVTITNN